MPTSHNWIGGYPNAAQTETITLPTDIESGQVFNATIGNRTLSYTFPDGPIIADVAVAIAAKWNASLTPEFAEIAAAAVLDSITSVATGVITMTAKVAGKPFNLTTTIGSGINEIQILTVSSIATGGTYILNFAGQITGNIAYDATANTVETALKVLSNIGASDVSVTGDAGGPYTITFAGDLTATDVALLISDTTLLEGTNEEQVITLGTATGGSFTLTYAGQETGNIAYNANAATVEAALEALSTIGSGNVSVSGTGPWTIEFTGELSTTNVALVSFDGTNLTGKIAAAVTQTTPGGDGSNERHIVQARLADGSDQNGEHAIYGNASVTGGTWELQIKIDGSNFGDAITAIPWDVTVAELQALVDETVNTYGASVQYQYSIFSSDDKSIRPAGNDRFSDGASILFQFASHLDGTVSQQSASYDLIADSTGLTGGAFTDSGFATPLYAGDSGSRGTEAGSWKFIIGGESTDDLDPEITAAALQSAIEGLSLVGAGNVQVYVMGNPLGFFPAFSGGGGYIIEFIGDLGNQATGFTITTSKSAESILNLKVWTSYTGASGTSEVQSLTITGSPGAGTFALRYGGESTALLDYNSTAEEIETALEGLSTVGTGGVVCTGGVLPGTAVTITFSGGLSGTDLDLIETDAGIVAESVAGGDSPTVLATTTQTPVTKVTTVACTGSNFWNVAGNWDTNTVPVTGDTVYIGGTSESVLYGLDQSAVTLAALHVEQTFAGFVGLPRTNTDTEGASYFEYRDQYLKIGATALFIGDKEGDGSGRIKIDLGTAQSTVLITDTGESSDGNTPPVLLLGTHASNVININRGHLGIAYYPTEVSTVATLRQAFIDDDTADTNVFVGTGVTLTNVIKSGGESDINSATTSFEQTAGTTTINDGAHALVDVFKGNLYYNSTDTLTAANISGDSILSFDQDRRPKDVTLINVFGSEPEIFDTSGCIVSPVIDLERGSGPEQLHLGYNFKLTVGVTS